LVALELPAAFDDPNTLLLVPRLDVEPKVFVDCAPSAPNKLELAGAGLASPKILLLCGPETFDDDDCPPVILKLNSGLLA